MLIHQDAARDALLTEHARLLLTKHYLRPGEQPQDGHTRAATAWGSDRAHAQRLYDAASQHHFMWASPVLSNAPALENEDEVVHTGQWSRRRFEEIKALPISCFLTYVDDSLEGLIDVHTPEARWLSVLGGGVGAHWSDLRAVSEKAPGPIPFIQTHDSDMNAYMQGKVRRGSYAAYMNVSHPDIEEFIQLRVPTGDEGRKCLGTGFHHGVNLTDAFMVAVARDAEWPLIDPKTGQERMPTAGGGRTRLRARYLWELMLETRHRTGEPYFCWTDTANAAMPEPLRRRGLRIRGSNLCSEIMLPTAAGRTAVCCLSSLNLEEFDAWGDTDLPGDVVEGLDNVLDHFIRNAPYQLDSARYSAMRERSVGLGVMGFHAYLQRHMVAYESDEALAINRYIFQTIRASADRRSLKLGAERGEAPDMEGTGERFAHKIAIAPTANSATIAGTSPSTELAAANVYTHRTRVGSHLVKNRYLERLLESKGQNTEKVWQEILFADGSVQGLPFLTDHEKAVFKTATEVDQRWVIRHAAARQPFIDQGQSCNLFVPPDADKTYLSDVHMMAWEMGLKSVYYLRTKSTEKADAVGKKVERVKLVDADERATVARQEALASLGAQDDSCVACEG